MSRKSFIPFALTAVLTLTIACGDKKSSATEPSGDTLSTAEFDSMVEALDAVGGFGFFGLGGRSTASAGLAAQQTYTYPYDETTSCAGGGSIREHGSLTYTLANNNTSYHYTGTLAQTYSDCKGTSSNGKVFTFNGGPSMTFDYSINTSTSTYNYTIHETGTLNWATSGKGGACSADINITISYTAAGVYSGSYTGTMCGQSINQTF